jgi:hypothetical protein
MQINKLSFLNPHCLYKVRCFAILCLFGLFIWFPTCGHTQDGFKRHITIYGNSPLLEQYPNEIAQKYDLVITEWWKKASISKVKKINPNITVLFYRDLNGVLKSYDDWEEIKKHPEWFVRDVLTDKPLVHKKFGWYLMDITNPEFRQHLQQYIQKKLKDNPALDGVFLDDTLAKVNQYNFAPEEKTSIVSVAFKSKYSNEYRDGVNQFLKTLKPVLKDKLVIINSDDESEFIKHVDGLMFEGFVHGSWQKSDQFVSTIVWQAEMKKLINLIKTGKLILVHSGSEGFGESIDKQFLYSFASFLLLANENTYFYFESSLSSKQLITYAQYYQNLGSSLQSPDLEFPKKLVLKEWSSKLNGWTINVEGVSVVRKDEYPAIQFLSRGSKGSFARKCVDIGGVGSITLSVFAKGNNIVAGTPSWQRFGLLGKFLDKNRKTVQGGIDLPFDTGSYDWKFYSTSYHIPPDATRYCFTSVGFYPSSTGIGWMRDLELNLTSAPKTIFKRTYENVVVLVNPTEETMVDSTFKNGLGPRSALISPTR